MARFDPAFNRTLGHEGGYVFDPSDRGGETYRGVARRFHPDWPGWRVVDGLRGRQGFPGTLDESEELDALVRQVYRESYWNRMLGDRIPSQEVAEELFDSGVNCGLGRAVQWLQRSLNALNRRGRSWPDLDVDGGLGPRTLAALRTCLERGDESPLLTAMNVLQGAHYLELMRRDESQERFARGWLRRVGLGGTAA